MKRIMFYINTLHCGGAQRVLTNLANKFSESGYETIVVISYADLNEYELCSNVKRYELEQKSKRGNIIARNVRRVLKLRQLIIKENPDVVVSFMAEPNFRAIISTAFLKIPLVISVRNDPNKEYNSKINKLLAKNLFKKVPGCVFQTEDAKKWFPKSIQNKSRIILNQVDEKFYNTERFGLRRDIISVGRLEKQKNHKLLINAFSMIESSFPNDKLRIYGNGSMLEELELYAKSLGLGDKVKFMGNVSNIQNKINKAKLFVLSSDYEGMPNALMEAMTMGIPCISTDCPCGGARALLGENSNYLVRVNDAVGLAEKIRQFLENEKLLDEMSNEMRKYAENFKPDIVFNEWEDYLTSIFVEFNS